MILHEEVHFHWRKHKTVSYYYHGQKNELASIHELLFAGAVDDSTRRRVSLFSNTLVLPGFNLYEAMNIDDPKKLVWKDHLFDLRARHLEQAVFDGADLTKADLFGAQLQGASLNKARLQGASLDHAQLQGASLNGVELQGASLDDAELQGASLYYAQLQGAVINRAQLQGASLDNAHLQGATLFEVQLQGASLDNAQLQGATLFVAQLQGASLDSARLHGSWLIEAQLQGASLDDAEMRAIDFSGAFLWRTQWGQIDLERLEAVRLEDAIWKPVWKDDFFSDPVRWTGNTYSELRDSMKSISEGEIRDDALKQIEILDCANPDKTLASCDPAAKPPHKILNLQNKLAQASVGDAAYAKALATELKNLVCASDANAIYILRGLLREIIGHTRLGGTNREAPALVDFIMSKDCAVSASLTDDDKAKLLKIKQDAEQKSAPPPAPKKEM